ncbi:MAG: methylated-DNA--[protein]-cysteine S-methyltransferase [Pseudomonadota bacterium]|nr:methylated-DNA--[protein]-cysteine S-methyltransferase [Pseudomonadota bacterium]
MSAAYQRIAIAIQYLQQHYQQQPSLTDIAEQIHQSPSHFQRQFQDWVGLSPKKFIQHLTLQQAKPQLQAAHSVFDTSQTLGLSSASRLHDLFVQIEGMTPGEFKSGGATLTIDYTFAQTPLGQILCASTQVGICHLAFCDDQATALQRLYADYPNAHYRPLDSTFQHSVVDLLSTAKQPQQLKLHLRGSAFQLKVWQALLSIPDGQLRSYSQLAHGIDHANAQRAVGSAIGQNPIAVIIPCHRVIQSSGALGGYRWGLSRKINLLEHELMPNRLLHDTDKTSHADPHTA